MSDLVAYYWGRAVPLYKGLPGTFLETFTLHHERLGPDDVRAALAAGVTREAVRDAFYVAFLFNTYDRLADTLGWELPDPAYYAKAGPFLLERGYL